jgi:glycosyltransferase involved in cell wall biosynthesis
LDILIVTPHFHPENFRINDFALEFQKRGHSITVLTAVPDYPVGKFFNGYGIFKKSREKFNGIKIYRAPLIPRGSGSNIRLALNYITFVIGGIFTSLFLLKNKIDIIFIFEPSPITVGLPAIFIKKIKRIPICLWVLDLWPESVVSAGNLKSGLIPKILNPIVKFIYKHSDRIMVSSKGFIKSIEEKGISRKKIQFFPQWAEPLFKPMRVKNNLLVKIPKESFKVMFAGNIGEAQDFPSVLKAAKFLKKNKNIQWLILGGGRKTNWVENKINEYGLENCFHLLGSYPLEKMPEFYASADAMLFSLKDEYIFSITIPAKVQSYLACGKPILAMVNGEAANVISGANAGFTCSAGDFVGLSKNILKMSKMPSMDLKHIGENSYNCYKKYFDRKMLFEKAENIFENLIYYDK